MQLEIGLFGILNLNFVSGSTVNTSLDLMSRTDFETKLRGRDTRHSLDFIFDGEVQSSIREMCCP